MLSRSRFRFTFALVALLLPITVLAQNGVNSASSGTANSASNHPSNSVSDSASNFTSNSAASASSNVPDYDDPNDAPLGDVARNLRRKTPPTEAVIDDDNLPQVMEEAESRRPSGSALRFLMAGESKGFQISAPDVSCSLLFNANAKSLLSGQYAQMDLPPADMAKLEGPATIEGDALTVSVFNGTEWHLSELAVALTVVKRGDPSDPESSGGSDMPRDAANLQAEAAVRPEKKPDMTVIYRMRAAGAPFARTVFSAPLNLELAPGDEWHWAIVQAKGYPPQSYAASIPQTSARTNDPTPLQPIVPSSLQVPQDSVRQDSAPQDSTAVPLPQAPQ